MRTSLLDDLRCPVSGDPLRLVDGDGDLVESGDLDCRGCGRSWPIRDGVPRLVPPDLELQQRKRRLADAILHADGSLLQDLEREDLELLLS